MYEYSMIFFSASDMNTKSTPTDWTEDPKLIYFVLIYTIRLDLIPLSTLKIIENQISKLQIDQLLTEKENFCQNRLLRDQNCASKAKRVNAELNAFMSHHMHPINLMYPNLKAPGGWLTRFRTKTLMAIKAAGNNNNKNSPQKTVFLKEEEEE